MQASLAMLGFLLGLAAWWWQGRDALWLAGAMAMLAPWPWTLLVIKPVNDRLNATAPERAGADSRSADRALGPAARRADGTRCAGDGPVPVRDRLAKRGPRLRPLMIMLFRTRASGLALDQRASRRLAVRKTMSGREGRVRRDPACGPRRAG